MAEHDLDAYLVFSEDAHNSEYVARCDERRSWLTGVSFFESFPSVPPPFVLGVLGVVVVVLGLIPPPFFFFFF